MNSFNSNTKIMNYLEWSLEDSQPESMKEFLEQLNFFSPHIFSHILRYIHVSPNEDDEFWCFELELNLPKAGLKLVLGGFLSPIF